MSCLPHTPRYLVVLSFSLAYFCASCLPAAEAARRMVGSITLLLRSWQAASGSASSQAELAAALERAAAHVAASAAKGGPLGRAGLQPKQLTVQQFEEEGHKHTCACMSVDTSALSE